MLVSRLLRHSAGGKNVSIAQRHYLDRSDNLLRAAVDEALDPYSSILTLPAALAGSTRTLAAAK